jgi:probable Rubsico expression protein CbbX
MCFTGNPGTGKTTVALRMAAILHRLGYVRKGHLVAVTRDDLVGQYIGHTAPKTREVLKKAMGGVLFIDEAYYLYRPENERDYGQEAIEILLQVMENQREDLVVILAGYKDRMDKFFESNPGMSSRIAHHIDFPDYGVDELAQIADLMLSAMHYRFDDEAARVFIDYLERRLAQPHFANARSVRNALDRARLRHASRLLQDPAARTDEAWLATIRAPDLLASRVFSARSPGRSRHAERPDLRRRRHPGRYRRACTATPSTRPSARPDSAGTGAKRCTPACSTSVAARSASAITGSWSTRCGAAAPGAGAAIDALHARKTRHYDSAGGRGQLALRPGILRLIREAQAARLPLAIATTTTPANIDALLRVPLGSDWRDLFGAVCDAGTAAVARSRRRTSTTPRWRRWAARSDCLAFEDSANGLRAARAAGIPTLVTPTAYTRGQCFDGALLLPGTWAGSTWRRCAAGTPVFQLEAN